MKRSWLWAFAMVLLTSVASANDASTEASEHFRRAVSLYEEADYRAALVEFRKAYQILPNTAVLYNIGQACYQLRDYAAALNAFEQYMTESGPSASHREEVQSTLQVLRARVGYLKIVSKTTNVELTIDDEPVSANNSTIAVSIGRRRIVASHKGSAPITRNIDVAAGETATVELTFDETPVAVPTSSPPLNPPSVEAKSSSTPAIVSYSIAGAFAVGATVTGILALSAKKDLDSERDSLTASRQSLDDADSRRKSFALATDLLALGAVSAAAVGVYFTISPPKSNTALRIRPAGSSIAGSLLLEGTF